MQSPRGCMEKPEYEGDDEMQRIAVYGRETHVAEQLLTFCKGEQLDVLPLMELMELKEQIRRKRIQMVILDIAMEERGLGAGVRMIQDMRVMSSLPLLVVSSQKSEAAKIAALSLGADDYLTADENPLVLMARIKSQLRRFMQLSRREKEDTGIYFVDELKVDDTLRKVTVEGREVKLTPTEYEILKLLVQEKGKVFSVPQIYEEIWNMRAVDVDNTIAVHVRHIREKIEENPRNPKYLKVIWGTGYKVG